MQKISDLYLPAESYEFLGKVEEDVVLIEEVGECKHLILEYFYDVIS
jgi:hypothetical protein